jgi:type I restriction enzyme, R subunit
LPNVHHHRWPRYPGKGFIRKPPKRLDYLEIYATFRWRSLKQRPPAGPQRIDPSKPKIIPRCSAFAYVTNGHDIIEFDYFTGMERACADCPTPAALWER